MENIIITNYKYWIKLSYYMENEKHSALSDCFWFCSSFVQVIIIIIIWIRQVRLTASTLQTGQNGTVPEQRQRAMSRDTPMETNQAKIQSNIGSKRRKRNKQCIAYKSTHLSIITLLSSENDICSLGLFPCFPQAKPIVLLATGPFVICFIYLGVDVAFIILRLI